VETVADGLDAVGGRRDQLAVEDQVFAPEVLGGYQVQPFDVPVFVALGRHDYGIPHYLWDDPKMNFSNLKYKPYEKSGRHPPYDFTLDAARWAADL